MLTRHTRPDNTYGLPLLSADCPLLVTARLVPGPCVAPSSGLAPKAGAAAACCVVGGAEVVVVVVLLVVVVGLLVVATLCATGADAAVEAGGSLGLATGAGAAVAFDSAAPAAALGSPAGEFATELITISVVCKLESIRRSTGRSLADISMVAAVVVVVVVVVVVLGAAGAGALVVVGAAVDVVVVVGAAVVVLVVVVVAVVASMA